MHLGYGDVSPLVLIGRKCNSRQLVVGVHRFLIALVVSLPFPDPLGSFLKPSTLEQLVCAVTFFGTASSALLLEATSSH